MSWNPIAPLRKANAMASYNSTSEPKIVMINPQYIKKTRRVMVIAIHICFLDRYKSIRTLHLFRHILPAT
jgi:hypothetical protein